MQALCRSRGRILVFTMLKGQSGRQLSFRPVCGWLNVDIKVCTTGMRAYMSSFSDSKSRLYLSEPWVCIIVLFEARDGPVHAGHVKVHHADFAFFFNATSLEPLIDAGQRLYLATRRKAMSQKTTLPLKS